MMHEPHPDPAVEARAKAIYLRLYGSIGAKWEANEAPQHWWELAKEEIRLERFHTSAAPQTNV